MIDVGGPAMLRAAAKSFASVMAVCRPQDYEPVLSELWAGQGTTTLELRRRLADDRVRAHGGVRLLDRALVPARRHVPRDVRSVLRPGARALVRREPAPGGGVLRGARHADASPLVRRAAPGQAALVQQPQRSVGRAPARGRARRAGLRDREAREPVRRRRRRDDRGGVREGARRGSGVGVRRRRRPERRGGRGARRRHSPTSSSRCCSRPRSDRKALETLQRKESLRVLEHTEQRAVDEGERDYRRVIGGLLVQERDVGGVLRAELDVVCGEVTEERWADLLFAWRGRQARDVERDRPRARRADDRHRRRADEPRRRRPHRGREGARARATRSTAPCSRRMRSSRSPTGLSSRSTRASRRSSSPAARSATPR